MVLTCFEMSIKEKGRMAANKKTDERLLRLRDALVFAGVVRGTRDKTVASVTGYAETSVRGVLSGHATLTDRFVKVVCSKFNIRFRWVDAGEEPMLARFGEQPYPGGGYTEKTPKITGNGLSETGERNVAPPIAGVPYLYNIAGVGSYSDSQRVSEGQLIDPKPGLLDDIISNIKLYFKHCGEEEYLGLFAAMAALNVISLPKCEIIDLLYQLRKLRDGDSDGLATAAADERFRTHAIKPQSRLKLERIPVEPDEE